MSTELAKAALRHPLRPCSVLFLGQGVGEKSGETVAASSSGRREAGAGLNQKIRTEKRIIPKTRKKRRLVGRNWPNTEAR